MLSTFNYLGKSSLPLLFIKITSQQSMHYANSGKEIHWVKAVNLTRGQSTR